MKEFDLSFRNPEVKMYASVVLPTVVIGLLLILFLNSNSNFMYAAAAQALGLFSFYTWRFLHRRKEKLKRNG